MPAEKPNHEAWLECEAYVLRRHFLSKAQIEGGKIVADVCASNEAVKCEEALKWIYDLLSAMDSKASALMRLNGVMLAAAAFLLGISSAGGKMVLQILKGDQIAIVTTATASAVSILLCLYVVNVSWYFLGKVSEGAGKLDYTEEFRMLQQTGMRRQFSYRTAWWVSLFATLIFVGEFGRQFLYVVFGWGF